jgi:hypothetical protein
MSGDGMTTSADQVEVLKRGSVQCASSDWRLSTSDHFLVAGRRQDRIVCWTFIMSLYSRDLNVSSLSPKIDQISNISCEYLHGDFGAS